MTAEEAAAEALVQRFGAAPEVGIVLGSGLSELASHVREEGAASYADLPGFLPSAVPGHAGRSSVGTWAGRRVVLLQGRVHGYEGHSAREVTTGVRALALWGVPVVILTNAAGGIADACTPGVLMIISDHLNLTGTSPLVGPGADERFVDMRDAYDPALRAALRAVPGFEATPEGVYAGLLGPQYETPAEIRMLKTLGADAVGMSTVLEAIALRAHGVRVAGISCITNRAAGLDAGPLDHRDVQARARALQADLSALIEGFLRGFSGIASPLPTR